MKNADFFCNNLRKFVDGEADTPFEYVMLLVVIVNTISIDTSNKNYPLSVFKKIQKDPFRGLSDTSIT